MKRKVLSLEILLIIILILNTITFCRKDDQSSNNPKENKQVERLISAKTGGSLITSDSINLIIPPNALPFDGNVFLGIEGSEPFIVPNKNLEIVGKPFTIRFPSESILKPVQLLFPRPSDGSDTTNSLILLFNGNTYFPVEYSLTSSKVLVTVDKINWESNKSKGVRSLLGEIVILFAKNNQTPSSSEMGLNKVSVDQAGSLAFNLPTANSTSKVLLLIHGWTGTILLTLNRFPG